MIEIPEPPQLPLSPLRCLIYASVSVRPLSEYDLKQILTVSRANNETHSITGMLVYHRGSFFQFLEGRPESVEHIFGRIQCDTRHKEITVLMDSTLSKRHFPKWSMGFPSLDAEMLSELNGYSDLARPGSDDLERLKSHVSRLFDLIAAVA